MSILAQLVSEKAQKLIGIGKLWSNFAPKSLKNIQILDFDLSGFLILQRMILKQTIILKWLSRTAIKLQKHVWAYCGIQKLQNKSLCEKSQWCEKSSSKSIDDGEIILAQLVSEKGQNHDGKHRTLV